MSRSVFITGASAGFGFDTVKALAERGHTVFATMRGVNGKNAEKANELREFAAAGGHAIHLIEADVTSDASVNAAVAQAIELGGFDFVINNAGVGNFGIDEGFDVGQAKRLFDVNLFGVMRVNRAVVPYFREKGAGTIAYVSSGLGRIIFPFLTIYTASKFALEAYAEGVNMELAPLGIETIIMQPGAYGTTFLTNSMLPEKDVTGTYGPTAAFFQAFAGAFMERAQAGQLGDPTEVVRAMVEEVERVGARPLRRTVGADVYEPVNALNEAHAQVQQMLMAHMSGGH